MIKFILISLSCTILSAWNVSKSNTGEILAYTTANKDLKISKNGYFDIDKTMAIQPTDCTDEGHVLQWKDGVFECIDLRVKYENSGGFNCESPLNLEELDKCEVGPSCNSSSVQIAGIIEDYIFETSIIEDDPVAEIKTVILPCIALNDIPEDNNFHVNEPKTNAISCGLFKGEGDSNPDIVSCYLDINKTSPSSTDKCIMQVDVKGAIDGAKLKCNCSNKLKIEIIDIEEMNKKGIYSSLRRNHIHTAISCGVKHISGPSALSGCSLVDSATVIQDNLSELESMNGCKFWFSPETEDSEYEGICYYRELTFDVDFLRDTRQSTRGMSGGGNTQNSGGGGSAF